MERLWRLRLLLGLIVAIALHVFKRIGPVQYASTVLHGGGVFGRQALHLKHHIKVPFDSILCRE